MIDTIFQTHPGATYVTCQRCKENIYAELERENGIVHAIWECLGCGAKASQMIGEINPDQATLEDEGED